MTTRRLVLGVLLGALVSLPPGGAGATSLPHRTVRASAAPDGTQGNGTSEHPVLSASGRVLAFDTTATNIAPPDENGPLRDVVAIDLATNERRLVSSPFGQAVGGDGPSLDPAMSADGQRVAFVSYATNLVAGDTNGQPDIFLRNGRDPIQRVSVGLNQVQANGPSGEPDVSADGTVVVFTSAASNLVPGDTNGQPDVFVRDLRRGTTTRVSVGDRGQQAAGRSLSPAISPDGRYVSFYSVAANLVKRDNNGVGDVFLRDLRAGRTERVSVSSSGRQQNKSVQPPFTQVSDVSDGGRYVVFDSDGTTLYGRDINQHTDVFLRDRRRGTTTLVSASSRNIQGNNDSFAPRLSGNGRFLTFQSFATNLAPGDGPREDIFLRDLDQGTTTVVNVTADGRPRGPERVSQLLQRPAVSNNGEFAAFSSTVDNLVPDDTNEAQDVFVRLLDPPTGRIVSRPPSGRGGIVKVAADDPLATRFLCQIDTRRPYFCGPSIRVRQGAGRRLTIRAGGPGMLFDPDPLVVALGRDRTRPTVSISAFHGHRVTVLRGTARDAGGLARVEVGLAYLGPGGCKYLATRHRYSKGFSPAACTKKVLVRADGTSRWSLRLPRSFRGAFVVYARAVDRSGNHSRIVKRKAVVA